MPDTGIIYLLTNTVNGKKYVGQTTDIDTRLYAHKNKTNRQVINQAIGKYGWENFEIKILEIGSVDNLDKLERKWIAWFDTYEGEGYNCTPGGIALQGKDHPFYGIGIGSGEENPKSVGSPELSQKILNDIVKFESHVKRLTEKYDLSEQTIRRIIKGEHWTIQKGELEDLVQKAQESWNGSVKVKTWHVKEILERREKGASYSQIAEDYPFCRGTVGNICRGQLEICDEVGEG